MTGLDTRAGRTRMRMNAWDDATPDELDASGLKRMLNDLLDGALRRYGDITLETAGTVSRMLAAAADYAAANVAPDARRAMIRAAATGATNGVDADVSYAIRRVFEGVDGSGRAGCAGYGETFRGMTAAVEAAASGSDAAVDGVSASAPAPAVDRALRAAWTDMEPLQRMLAQSMVLTAEGAAHSSLSVLGTYCPYGHDVDDWVAAFAFGLGRDSDDADTRTAISILRSRYEEIRRADGITASDDYDRATYLGRG